MAMHLYRHLPGRFPHTLHFSSHHGPTYMLMDFHSFVIFRYPFVSHLPCLSPAVPLFLWFIILLLFCSYIFLLKFLTLYPHPSHFLLSPSSFPFLVSSFSLITTHPIHTLFFHICPLQGLSLLFPIRATYPHSRSRICLYLSLSPLHITMAPGDDTLSYTDDSRCRAATARMQM